MHIRLFWRSLVRVVATISLSAILPATFAADAPSPEFISLALREQLTRSPVEIAYIHTASGEPETVARFRYARSRQVQFLEGKPEDSNDDRASRIWFDADAGSSKSLYTDENGTVKGRIDLGRRNTQLAFADLPDPVLYNFPAGTLMDLARSGSVSTERETINGHLCWRVEISPTSLQHHRYVAWLDSEVGFCPRRVETYADAGRCIVALFSSYVNLGKDVWYPTAAQWVHSKDQEVLSSASSLVTEYALVPESRLCALDFAFPSGTEVDNLILDAVYVAP